MKCNKDTTMMLKFVKRERIFDFLTGLNVEYDKVKVQVLGKEDLPPLNEVFSIIRAEEGRRSVMLDTPTTEGSALEVKCSDHQSTKMPCGMSNVKNRGIPKRPVGNPMESHNHLVEEMEINMHNLDSGMVKPILPNLKRIPNQKSQPLMIQMMVD
ncbi:hypothetical protein AAG906_037064 [Vitis piasezkii]